MHKGNQQREKIPQTQKLNPEIELALLRQYFRSIEERLAIGKGTFLKDIPYQLKIGAIEMRVKEAGEIAKILKNSTDLLDNLNPQTIILIS